MRILAIWTLGWALGAAASHPAILVDFLVDLRVDQMQTPLGIDDARPHFQWRMRDGVQAAYQIDVASSQALLTSGKPDLWSSGRVESDRSVGIAYGGAPLKASTRYVWRVRVWRAGVAQPDTASSWWETGLMSEEAWKASQWIGYETGEETAERHAKAQWTTSATALGAGEQHYGYRATVQLHKPVKSAALFATGQDTVSAWVNGKPLLTAEAFPPFKQMPWKKYRRAEAAEALQAGANTIAIEQIHYNAQAHQAAPPIIAALVVEYADGTWESFASSPQWKSATTLPNGWTAANFDDASWTASVPVPQPQGPRAVVPGRPWIPDAVKVLAGDFRVSKPVRAARLYATALGLYEARLNGAKVSDDVFTPGWTDYRERVLYQTYDVTRSVKQGANQLSAQLAPGWYATPLEWFQQPNNYGATPPALRMMLRLEYEDGSVQWVSTNSGWRAGLSRIVHSELYDGETQDLRREARPTAPVLPITPAPIRIQAQDFSPVRAMQSTRDFAESPQFQRPPAVTHPQPGVFIYDFGQNFTGTVRLNIAGKSGQKIEIHYGELLNANGTLYTENLRTAKSADTFYLGNDSQAVLASTFTYHGFRYAEVRGLDAPLDTQHIEAVPLYLHETATAHLSTGSAMLNQLWSNIQWGQRSNFLSVPTDCPQRDERLGWAGDAEVFWRAASYNMDLGAFSRKYAADLRATQAHQPYYGIYAPGTATEFAAQAAGWSDAGVIVPWTSWLQTGDTKIIDENWTAMHRYLDAIETANPDFLWKKESGIPFGDWLSTEGKTDYGLIATAYWAWDVTLMRQMAHATGRAEDEAKYARLFEQIRAAFQKQYVSEGGFVAGADHAASPFWQMEQGKKESTARDTQTGYVLALHMNLLPDEQRVGAARHLAEKIAANHGHLGTGFLGTPYLLEELTKAGYSKLAYDLLLSTDYPSWGYMVEHGATTMWERWNGDQMKSDPGMNSYNHYAYGAVADWIARYAAGIDATPLDAGFHTVLLHPVFDARLGQLRYAYDSPMGRIVSEWTVRDGVANWRLQLPPNTRGLLAIRPEEAKDYRVNGQIPAVGAQGVELEPATYQIQVQIH